MIKIIAAKRNNQKSKLRSRKVHCVSSQDLVGFVWFKVLNATFNKIQFIVAVSFIDWGNRSTRKKPPICRKSLTNCISSCCIECISPWTGFERATLAVIGTVCTSSYKSDYHMITTTATPSRFGVSKLMLQTIIIYMSYWHTMQLHFVICLCCKYLINHTLVKIN